MEHSTTSPAHHQALLEVAEIAAAQQDRCECEAGSRCLRCIALDAIAQGR